jgi:predicted ATPase
VRLRIQNIGLVKDAEFDVRDLTLVMGPNSAGKSTIATVLYAVLRAAPGRQSYVFGSSLKIRQAIREAIRLLTRDQRERIAGAVSSHDPEAGQLDPSMVPEDIIDVFRTKVIEAFQQGVVAELERAFGDDLSTLQRRAGGRRRGPSRIVVGDEVLGWSVNLQITATGLSWTEDHGSRLATARPLKFDRVPTMLLEGQERDWATGETLDLFLRELLGPAVARALFDEFPSGVHYLPAARSGLLQSHRIVAAAMVQRAASAGIREMSVPALSGVVADFISSVIEPEMGRKRRYGGRAFETFAQEIEAELLGGRVTKNDSLGYPELEFTDESGKYPMQRASSMVTELTPIVLLLRGAVQEDDLVILEEPESHLHPETQHRLASVLFDLAAKVPVVLTTHSDYVVSTINNRIRAEELGTKQRTTVTALQMHRNADGSASAVELEVDPVDGISEENFTDVATALYDEQVEQQIKLVSKGA